ncbi:hypothetical protein SAMN05216228_10012 [Rhizobium tibeticum]|uniref:Uncharacterized protein n=1 Tax=Rhizobium tibeticum TaxID=501024 RepID=A0A1H8C591_9HYPH|nr:hypothetical protein RTCCBAU85039_0450 [Rhizobium tibeticum]SEM90226.1 hypothetical protein SAMN05216228_10012 [Rhizobium tibeticum]
MARMEVSEAKRLKALEDEIARLKKLLAEQMLQPHSASFSKKMVLPAAKRDAVTHLKAVMGLSERQACQINIRRPQVDPLPILPTAGAGHRHNGLSVRSSQKAL